MAVESTDSGDTSELEVSPDVTIDEDALTQASGGQMNNSTLVTYSSTFIPFDSSF